MRHTHLLRSTAVGVLTAALALTGLAGVPVQAADPAIVVTGVKPVNSGGGLSGHLPIACSVVLDFTDATPAAGLERYRLRIERAALEPVVREDAQAGEGAGAYRYDLDCDFFVADEAAAVVVEELGETGEVVESSAPQSFTLLTTGHPSNVWDTSEMVDGRWTNYVGQPASIVFEGEWEPGTRFHTRVWTSKTADFTPEDWNDNVNGDAALVESRDADAPVLGFTPRERDAGRYVWISIIGQKAGKVAYRYTFDPEYVAPVDEPPVVEPPAQPALQPVARWYRSFGTAQGVPRVRRTVGVTPPVLTTEGSAAKISVTYRWYAGGRAIPGATKSTYRVQRKYLRKRLFVHAVFSAPGHLPITRSWSLGRVRR